MLTHHDKISYLDNRVIFIKVERPGTALFFSPLTRSRGLGYPFRFFLLRCCSNITMTRQYRLCAQTEGRSRMHLIVYLVRQSTRNIIWTLHLDQLYYTSSRRIFMMEKRKKRNKTQILSNPRIRSVLPKMADENI